MSNTDSDYKVLQKKITNVLKNKNYTEENINNCENTISHVYRILNNFSNKSKNEIINECNNALIYYIEFVKQLKDNNETEIQFTEIDINTFIFNKIFKGIKFTI